MNLDNISDLINWANLSGIEFWFQEFHFLRPGWLIGIPIALIVGLMFLFQKGNTRWENLIPAEILEALRVPGGTGSNAWKLLLPICLIMASVAAAGPSWQKIPVPTTKAQSAIVILLDLSPSMLATDIAPDRITRVKYKLIDILRTRKDGQTGLIAYAGSPHRVAPLTDDVKTIEALLPALHPFMMPVQGSNTESAVELAIDMLKTSGSASGDILLITDGINPDAQKVINDHLDRSAQRITLSILGVGSTEAVPIPKANGGFVSDSRGEIILTELNRNELQILAAFQGGRYVEIQTDDSDVQYLMENQNTGPTEADTLAETTYDSWEDAGYYLVLLLLPAVLVSFRRGLVFCLPLMLLLPEESQALELKDIQWKDLWQTPDQQAYQALQNNDTETAAETFESPEWASYSHYRNGDYADSEATLSGLTNLDFTTSSDSANSRVHYNRGNALALDGNLEDAIEAYDSALALNPDMEDAAYNKEVIEKFLEQQQQNQQNDQSDSNQSQDQSDSQQSDRNSGENNESQENENNQNSDQNSAGNDSQNEQNPDAQNSEEPQEEASEGEPDDKEENETEQANENETGDETDKKPDDKEETTAETAQAAAEPLEQTPEQLDPSSEQWLRAIPDDPSGLLRQKFLYESEVYRQQQRYLNAPPGSKPGDNQEKRY